MAFRYWYNSSGEEVVGDLISTVESVINEQTGRRTEYERYASFYKDRRVSGFEPGEFASDGDMINLSTLQDPLTYNVIKAAIDTVVSKISLNRPRPQFLTEGGSEKMQQKAKNLGKFVDGVIYRSKANRRAVQALRDACIYGIGILKVYDSGGEVCVEKVHPSRIVVDDNAALDGRPKSIFQKEYISREALLSMFPKSKEVILSTRLAQGYSHGGARDLLEVYEGWHLPCGDQKGRHVICVSGGKPLLDEKWEDKNFPFVIIRWCHDIMGWHGIGIAHELEGIQTEINTLLEKIRENMDLLTEPYILKPRGSEVSDENFSNERGKVIEYSGNIPPRVEIPPAIHPQVFQQLDSLYNRAFEVVGVSQLSATSSKPPGVESGVALRTLQDVETQRFNTFAHEWEQFFVELAKKIIQCAGRIAEDGDFVVKYSNRHSMEKINWKEVDLNEDSYVLKVFPVSSLPQTPGGKLETVIDMIKAGLIPQDMAANLLDFPDLDKYTSLMNSALDDIEMTMEHILMTGNYVEPLPFQNLQLGLKVGTHYYLRAKVRGEKEERLELIMRWLIEAEEMLTPPPVTEPAVAGIGPIEPQQQIASPMAGIPGAGGPPGGMPEMPGGMPGMPMPGGMPQGE